MTRRALRFGSVAAAYELFRLGYPDELVDQVLTYAGRPVHAALEIGAGTGKATRVFAAAYDLVFAAASFHWTRPEQRWERVAAMLVRGGVFASFGGPLHLADPEVDEAVRIARAPFLPDDEVASPDGTPVESELQWPGTELVRSGLFTDVRQTVIERRPTVSAQEYVGHLATVSAYLELADPDREQVLDRILDALPGRVPIRADITLHLARLERPLVSAP
jgi:hypothetical protein